MKCYVDDFKIIKVVSDRAIEIENLVFLADQKKIELKLLKIEGFNYQLEIASNIDFKKSYEMYYHQLQIPVIFRYISHTLAFDQQFYYDQDDLGANYHQDATVFKVYSPVAKSIFLELIDLNKSLKMERNNGIFELKVDGDLENQRYLYQIIHQDKTVFSIDPYNFASTKNAQASVVLNPLKFIQKQVKPQTIIESYVDASIYEISVRDLTSHFSSLVLNKGKLEGLLEQDTHIFNHPTAYNYLKQLGVSHIQIMPVFDFDSYDEDDYLNNYNWGYDPIQYSTIEGSYLKDDTPYNRVNILKAVVNQFHQDDMRVNLDVVFNHVFKTEHFAFEKLVPFYSFRYNLDDSYSNGSFCGNEIRSEALMMRKYIVDMCLRYIKLFDIDGLRFDLMGLLDIETMNLIYQKCSSIKKDFMIYGEGWDMPTVLNHQHKAINYHNYQMPNIAFFNNIYRDVLKGATMMDAIYDVGYLLGDLSKFDQAVNLILGSSLDGTFKNNSQSINYLACHDNMTFYDKMNTCLKLDYYTYKRKAKLALAVLCLSQGVPFIHCGQEFLRTKYGYDNSYNLSDEINGVDWYLSIKNSDVVDSFKKILKFRKKHSLFRLKNNDDLSKIKVYRYFDVMVLENQDYLCFINVSDHNYHYHFEDKVSYLYGDEFEVNTLLNDLHLQAISLNIVKRN